VNGLADATRRLRNVPGIGFVTFTRDDIVRHGMVRHIVEAYENPEGEDEANDDLPDFIKTPVAIAS
jgi:phosphate starvation-inducible PhoH-like protein